MTPVCQFTVRGIFNGHKNPGCSTGSGARQRLCDRGGLCKRETRTARHGSRHSGGCAERGERGTTHSYPGAANGFRRPKHCESSSPSGASSAGLLRCDESKTRSHVRAETEEVSEAEVLEIVGCGGAPHLSSEAADLVGGFFRGLFNFGVGSRPPLPFSVTTGWRPRSARAHPVPIGLPFPQSPNAGRRAAPESRRHTRA